MNVFEFIIKIILLIKITMQKIIDLIIFLKSQIYFWNSLYDYVFVCMFSFFIFVFVSVFKRIFIKNFFLRFSLDKEKKKLTENILRLIPNFLLFLIYIFPFIFFIDFWVLFSKFIRSLYVCIVIYWIINLFIKLIYFYFETFSKWNDKSRHFKTNLDLVNIIIKIFLIVWLSLFFLNNIWVEITPLLASLWVVSVAIAFWLQKILSDIFSSFSIYFDKPFNVWDFVVIWTDSWIIKQIWFKSTRISTLSGEELVLPNSEITNIRINNFAEMKKRRILFHFWIEYETWIEKIEKIPLFVQDIISKIEHTNFSRCHFQSFWDCGLIFEIVYFVTKSDYDLYMNIQQTINIELMKKFTWEWINFAYPTQKILLNK